MRPENFKQKSEHNMMSTNFEYPTIAVFRIFEVSKNKITLEVLDRNK